MQEVNEIKARLNEVQNFLQREVGKKEALEATKARLTTELCDLSNLIDLDSKAKILLDLFVKSTEQDVRKKIEPVVNEAFKYVFDQNLFFHLIFVTRRNQIEIDFVIIRDRSIEQKFLAWSEDTEKYEKEIADVIESTKNINYMYGGSVNQVLSLILIFSLVELLNIEGPIVLDEPTSMVDETYNSRLGQLIASLSAQFNRQYIFLTHSTSLAAHANKIYSVKKMNFTSYIKEGIDE